MRSEDLPLVTDEEEMRRVHRTDGLYFVVRGGKAHYEMTCQHIEDLVEAGKIVRNPRWPIATYNESRAVGIPGVRPVVSDPFSVGLLPTWLSTSGAVSGA